MKKHKHKWERYGAVCACGKQHWRCWGCRRNKIGRNGKLTVPNGFV